MEVLRNLFGNLTTGIIRLVVGVGILAAAYFFIVKPVLDTTKEISHEFNTNEIFKHETVDVGKEVEKAMAQVNSAIERSVGPNVTAVEARQVRRTFKVVKQEGNPRRVIKCIQHARGDVAKIQRCALKF
jgi:hypothetical protein